MLQAFFLWFYCLSITDAILQIIIICAGYLILCQWLGNKRFWLPVIALLFLAWLAVIAGATLTDRTPGIIPAEPELIPFILVAALFALVSAGIEFCQYHFALGQAEADDVIHNALGALIGALISTIPVKWKPGKLKKLATYARQQ